MIEVELPDGTIAEFPEGTSQDVIRSALQKRFSRPKVGVGEDALKSLGSGAAIGAAVLGDAINPINMVRDLADAPRRFGNLARGKMVKPRVNMPATAAASQLYQPQTNIGRYLQSGASGAVSGLVGGPMGALAGFGGGIGGEGLGDATEYAIGPEARGYGEFLGSVLGSMGIDAGRRAVTQNARIEAARNATKAAKDAAYKVVDTSQERIAKSSVQKFVQDARDTLKRQGYTESSPEYAPIKRKLEELNVKPSAELTPAGFDAYMKGLDDIAGRDSPAARLAGSLKRQVGGFLDDIDSPDIRTARTANRKNEAFLLADDIERRIRQRAPGTTAQTAAKDELRSVSNDKTQMAFLMEPQRAAVSRGAETTGLQRGMREVAKLSPNRLLGFGATGLAGGAAVGGAFNPLFLAPPALGIGAEMLYRNSVNRATRASLDALRSLPPQQRYSGLGALSNLSQDEIERLLRKQEKPMRAN
jgi:hypothetical protein